VGAGVEKNAAAAVGAGVGKNAAAVDAAANSANWIWPSAGGSVLCVD
jgi:hypothetical protein